MPENVKRIDIKEFREKGYLQEANRLFFHPLGLALEVIIDKETGEEKLGGIWDYREDPEGILFDIKNRTEEEIKAMKDKRDFITKEKMKKIRARNKLFRKKLSINSIEPID
jgi:hypothetical protein